ncbi:MAG TPA: VWA domain-containing protein [Gammaproteobacteria bacterium]|nr:VWA domain-containing protein [Gammaproteobacteria bacterium]
MMLCLLLVALPPAMAERKPLLMEGKKTLYQRVLTRPGASLVKQPGQTDAGKPLAVFSRFYVYARSDAQGKEWLEVGPDPRGNTSGWLRADLTVPWKQQLVLAFANPAGRERNLLFASRDALADVLESEEAGKLAAGLRAKVEKGGRDERVISIEPETYVDINKQFYLLPILQSEEIYTALGPTARVLEVASVTRDESKADGAGGGGAAEDEDAGFLKSFKAAVVFVIDSTVSMGPYIERTREAVTRIYRRIEAAGMLDRVKFGLVAYRSNVEVSPGLEYVAREYVDPVEVQDGKDFLSRVKALKRATVSTARFSEDSYAGLMLALDEVDWKEFGARYMILVTDAGALKGDDPLSATGLDAEQVRLEALHRGVATYVMHLKTPQGKKNHASAEAQYRTLSTHPLLSNPLYYPVKTGSVEQFGKIVDSLADAIVEQVEAARKGGKVAGSAASASADFGTDTSSLSQEEKVREDIARLGYAMQLAYLGRVKQTQAPPVFRAWITDIDFDDPIRRSVDVHVLLTKKQLSDMQLVLKGIVDAANEGLTSPEKFYDSLRSFVSVLGRDPNAVVQKSSTRLADMGLLGEYLDDLPYKSRVMNLDQDTWSRWGVQEQLAFINSVKSMMRLYEIYNSDTGRWISLAEGSDPADHVYPVPLDALP